MIDPSMNIYFSFPFCWMAMTTLKKCIDRKKIPLISYFMIFFLLPNVIFVILCQLLVDTILSLFTKRKILTFNRVVILDHLILCENICCESSPLGPKHSDDWVVLHRCTSAQKKWTQVQRRAKTLHENSKTPERSNILHLMLQYNNMMNINKKR